MSIKVDQSRYIMIPLRQLRPAPWNYKQTGAEVDEAKVRLRSGMEARGQILNLVVRELGGPGDPGHPGGTAELLYEVVNGNHRLELLLEDGAEAAMCYNLGTVDQATAELIALETNGEYVQADPEKLGQVLRHAAETVPLEQMLATLPFTPVQVDQYMRGVDLAEPPAEEAEEPAAEQTETAESARVMIGMTLPRELGEEFKAQLKRFDTDAEAIRLCVDHLKGIVL